MTEEEKQLLSLYRRALIRLATEDPRYVSNLLIWNRWLDTQRLKWIYRMEVEAEAGLPLAVELVSTATLMRITQ